jgi:hypothetical protein
MMARQLFFCVVLSDGDHWRVEAEWPDGTIEQVDNFKSHFEAVNWISAEAEAWLRHRSFRDADD